MQNKNTAGIRLAAVRVARRYLTAKKPLPKTVERYHKEHIEQGKDEGYAWALAWSRYCRKFPGSPRCHQEEYFHGEGFGGGKLKE